LVHTLQSLHEVTTQWMGHGSVLHARALVSGLLQVEPPKVALCTMLRARVCVPPAHVRSHVVHEPHAEGRQSMGQACVLHAR
jgi:hypothetical protein